MPKNALEIIQDMTGKITSAISTWEQSNGQGAPAETQPEPTEEPSLEPEAPAEPTPEQPTEETPVEPISLDDKTE